MKKIGATNINSKTINQAFTLSISKTMVRNFIIALIVLIPVALFNMWILTTVQAIENQHEIRLINVENTLNYSLNKLEKEIL